MQLTIVRLGFKLTSSRLQFGSMLQFKNDNLLNRFAKLGKICETLLNLERWSTGRRLWDHSDEFESKTSQIKLINRLDGGSMKPNDLVPFQIALNQSCFDFPI